jgi:protocatechuate 3,4-dioxygenase beta subunit
MRLLFPVLLLACHANAQPREPLVGGPCEGCEAVFEGRPATLRSTTRIAPVTEPGEPMILEGTVRDARKQPVAGVIVYAYHTNAKGLYPTTTPPSNAVQRHGTLRAFAKTDARGAYRFETIRPASYPRTKIPQHVHMHVVEPGRCTYFIDETVFTDDPMLTDEVKQREHAEDRGGRGVVTPSKITSGWLVRRDITLGANIPDYARCGER